MGESPPNIQDARSLLPPSVPFLLAATIPRPTPERKYIFCAVDGADASGKTHFAEELACELQNQGQSAVVIHLDDFMNTRLVRYAKGRHSPQGFYQDTYNYAAFISSVLEPLQPGGSGKYRIKTTDYHRDTFLSEIESPWITADSDGLIFLIEGLFLHRSELIGYWDWSTFLLVSFEITAARMLKRDGLGDGDPNCPTLKRYVNGQRIYYCESKPWRAAKWVVDNSDFEDRKVTKKEEIDHLEVETNF